MAEGDPRDLILHVASEVGADVMGACGLGRMSSVLLGSVSQRVVQGARSPVLIVR